MIIFQYNPDTLTRTITAQTTGGEAGRSEALRLKGAPVETIKLDVRGRGQSAVYEALSRTRLVADDIIFVPENGRSIMTRFIDDFLNRQPPSLRRSDPGRRNDHRGSTA